MAIIQTNRLKKHLPRFIAMFLISSFILAASVYGQTSQTLLTSTLCGIIQTISQIIGILALFMFILGGTTYAFAHLLPAAGNIKGAAQGWGMSVLMGGIIMILLYTLAPFIVNTVMQFSIGSSSGLGIGTIGAVNCPGVSSSGGIPSGGISSGSGIIPGETPGTCTVSGTCAV